MQIHTLLYCCINGSSEEQVRGWMEAAVVFLTLLSWDQISAA